MHNQYFYFDGTNVIGPHSGHELSELLRDGIITDETQMCPEGSKDWIVLKQLPVFSTILAEKNAPVKTAPIIEDETSDQVVASIHAVSAEKEDECDAAEEKERKVSKHHLIRTIRKELDSLWEAQREVIVCAIKNEPLPKEYETTRRQNKQIYERIEAATIDYWRRSTVLEDWVSEITWKTGGEKADCIRKLRGSNEAEKYADLQQWLIDNKLSDLSGCYCFRKGKEYLYIGKATVLSERLKQHEKKYFWTYADSVRIIIPKIKSQISKMERLLILRYSPAENSQAGELGKNQADDCLDFIRTEVKELLDDF